MGSSCFARGNDENLNFIESYTKEKGLDAEIELIGSRCENQCAEGPNIMINDKYYGNMNIEKIKKIMDGLAK